jgi:Zn-finger nucleic acid-binding protein
LCAALGRTSGRRERGGDARDVWLDRGERDKLLEAVDRDDDDRFPDRGRDREPDWDRDRDRYEGDRSYPGRRRKKKSFLGEMFEFGD